MSYVNFLFDTYHLSATTPLRYLVFMRLAQYNLIKFKFEFQTISTSILHLYKQFTVS